MVIGMEGWRPMRTGHAYFYEIDQTGVIGEGVNVGAHGARRRRFDANEQARRRWRLDLGVFNGVGRHGMNK